MPALKPFLKTCSQSVWQQAITCCLCYGVPQITFIPWTCDLLVCWKTMRRHSFSTLHHLSPLILPNATVVAFVLLCISRFNFHCYTQRDTTPTQKSARVWQLWPFVTFCAKDYKRHSLTNANKFGWTAQYPTMCTTALCSGHTYMWAVRKRLTKATTT